MEEIGGGLPTVISEYLDDTKFSKLCGFTETTIFESENMDDTHLEVDENSNNEENENASKLEKKFTDIDCMNSNDEDSIHSSDDETQWPVFNPKTKLHDHNLVVGMLFSSKNEFKEAVKSWSIGRGKTIKFSKYDNRRCKVICRRPNCPFVIYISKHEGGQAWQIRSFQDHTCTWNYHNKTLTSTIIANKFVHKIRNNPQCQLKLFRREVIDELKLHVSKSQARKAIIKARKLVNMKEGEQFSKIWDYCLEISKTNAGSTICVQTTMDTNLEGNKTFLRMYVCFDACKKGFIRGCRPIIGVDGCFLKGQQGGQLLTAVSLDGNNNIFPIAWVVVESETRMSWEWFLDLLARDLNIFENQSKYTFISDKQKGLISAFDNILPNVTNRFCVRHLHQNYKLAGFKGLALKNILWAAAKSTTINQFDHYMTELAKLDCSAYKWLNEREPSDWSRSHFNNTPKCDTLLNNMCECFNAFILEARELPIISMFEYIRTLVMKRMQEKRDTALKYNAKICPRIVDILGKNIYEAGNCIGVKADDDNYQITTMQGAQYTVNLETMQCSCRRWELTGLPCIHACAAINIGDFNHDDYVHKYYTVEIFKKAYELNIMPTNGYDEWPKSNKAPLLPPKYNTTKRGRPSKLRRKGFEEQGESQRSLRRSTVILHCTKCRSSGHNSRGCDKKKGKVTHIDCDSQATQILDGSTQTSSNKRLLVYASKRKKTVYNDA